MTGSRTGLSLLTGNPSINGEESPTTNSPNRNGLAAMSNKAYKKVTAHISNVQIRNGFAKGAGGRQENTDNTSRRKRYPLNSNKSDSSGLNVPFPLLIGEHVDYIGENGGTGTIVLSNYRLFIHHPLSFVNTPIGLIESIEYRDAYHLLIHCKDARIIR